MSNLLVAFLHDEVILGTMIQACSKSGICATWIRLQLLQMYAKHPWVKQPMNLPVAARWVCDCLVPRSPLELLVLLAALLVSFGLRFTLEFQLIRYEYRKKLDLATLSIKPPPNTATEQPTNQPTNQLTN